MNKFEIGDKVRICQSRIDEYWNNTEYAKDGSEWCDEAKELFRSGRVFTITNYAYPDDDQIIRYYIDEGIGGRWRGDLLVKHEELPGDLFQL